MPSIEAIRDAELSRLRRNQTESQQRKAGATREGVVVNSLIKDPKHIDMNDLYNSMVISDDARLPDKLYEDKITPDKSLAPISIISVGVMGVIALISALVKRSAKINLTLKPVKRLEHLTRNVSITDESIQGIYQMVQCPNQKTILAGTGVIVLGSMAFMGKMFIDGFKEVWIKKREADIQKNLQENLVAVETQSFSGKIQIIRGMLAEKAGEFNDYLCSGSPCPPVFESFNKKIKFSGKNTDKKSFTDNLKYFAMGVLTLGAIAGLGFLSIKNLRKSKKHLETYVDITKKQISAIISQSTKETRQRDKTNLINMFQAIESDENQIRNSLAGVNLSDAEKQQFIDDIVFETQKSTTQADRAMGGDGKPKPAFNSYVNDYRAFFYNYLLDSQNPQFKMLFWGVTALTAFSYSGQALGEAMKDVQVKKFNAQTELDLQKRLVATELRNFKAKKDAAIEPLCDEFYVQLQNAKPKEELRTIAENILFEVKNGPPFVYS